MNRMSSTSINARMNTSGHGLSKHFKGQGAVANGLIGIKCVREMSLFAIGAEYARAVSFPADKNLGLRSNERGAATQENLSVCGLVFIRTLSSFGGRKLTSEIC